MANQIKYDDICAFQFALNEYQDVTTSIINGEGFVHENGDLVPIKQWDKKNPKPIYEPTPRVSANGTVNYSGVITIDHNK